MDASLLVGTGFDVQSRVTRLEGGVPLLQQALDRPDHPGLLVGMDLNVFILCDNVYAVADVA